MSINIDAHEILLYLRELGYINITPHQLKDFMKDLKKLVKYEECKNKLLENQENEPCNKERNQEPTIFETLHATGTVASNAKQVPKKESIIAVQIYRPARNLKIDSECSTDHINKSSQTELSSDSKKHLSENASQSLSDLGTTKEIQTDSRPISKSCATLKSKDRRSELRPRSSFIRPRIPVKTTKSDPVALYQKYQEEWKRAKIPGEDNRSALRWAVREKLLGGGDAISYGTSSHILRTNRL